MNGFEIVPAAELPLAEQASIANQAFAGYVAGWNDLGAATLARFLLVQGADLFYSRFIRNMDGLLGFGYINRTGNIVRLTGMGIIPAARGSGAAGDLLRHLFGEAKERGDEAMMLEVIEQNPRAVALYRRHDFREITRLPGWRRAAAPVEAADVAAKLEEISSTEALRFPSVREYPEIPWQISRHALAKAPMFRAFRAGGACVAISDPEVPPIRFYGLTTASGDWAELRRTLGAVLQRFADHEFLAVAIWPEEYGSRLFEPLGFTREPLNQFLMRRDF